MLQCCDLQFVCAYTLLHILSDLPFALPIEPHHEKNRFLFMRKQRRRSAELISTFVFAIHVYQFLIFVNPKFQVCSLLL